MLIPPSAGRSALFVFFLLASAHAQPVPQNAAERRAGGLLPVTVADCPEGELDALSRILSIELEALSPRTAVWLTVTHPEAHLRCEGEMLDIRVVEPVSGRFTGQRLHRQGEMKSDLARFVALILVELVASQAASADPEAPTPPAQSVEVRITRKSITQPAKPYPRPILAARVALFGGGQPFSLNVGAGLVAELVWREHLAVAVDFQFLAGREETPIGDIENRSFSGAVHVLGRVAHPIGDIEAGAGVRTGALVSKGIPNDAASVVGMRAANPFGGPCVALQSRFRVWGPLRATVSAEIGFTLWRVDALADERVAVSQQGFWVLAGLGMGVAPR